MAGCIFVLNVICVMCQYIQAQGLRLNQQGMGEATAVMGFLKTHKTGSSTMLKILQSFAHKHGMKIKFPQDNHYLGYAGPFPGEANKENPPGKYDLIANHAVFHSVEWKKYLNPNPFFVSVLREPSNQAISAYDCFDTQGHSFGEHLHWLAALQSPAHGSIGLSKHTAKFLNPQAWDFGWYEYVGHTTQYDRNATMINQWLKDLDQDFTNVMILENFDESLALLARSLHVKPQELAYAAMNEHKGKNTVPSEGEYSKLAQLYSVDRALYQHFNKTFWSHWLSVPEKTRIYDLALLRSASGTVQAQCTEKYKCPPDWPWSMSEIGYTCFLHISTTLDKTNLTSSFALINLKTECEQYAEGQRAEELAAALEAYSGAMNAFHR